MNKIWQRAIILCIMGLPITWKNVEEYWWLVILWVCLLFGLNILLYGHIIQFKEYLDSILNSGNIQ